MVEDVDRCKHMASSLGNGAIVETVDRHVLVLQRSSNVGEFPGHLVFPGGHSEVISLKILAFFSLLFCSSPVTDLQECFQLCSSLCRYRAWLYERSFAIETEEELELLFLLYNC